MSFYQTNNSSIVRFSVHDPAKKAVAPFATLQRVAKIQNLGGGYSGYYTGTNTNWALQPEQLQNGQFIISAANNATGGSFTLPSAYSLQQFLGGSDAFNMIGNLTTQANTGLNSYFILNVYNLSTNTGNFIAYDNQSSKQIAVAAAANDSTVTPVLIQFNGVNSTYATENGVANYVSYTLY
jgi:hypothetical protein